MTDLGEVVFGILISMLAVFLVFFVIIAGTLMGLFTGWVISITPLNWWVVKGFEMFGLNVSGYLPHIGAALGFISGFFTTKKSKKDKD